MVTSAVTVTTLSGIVIDLSESQFKNAQLSMLVTLSGIVIDVSELQL